MLHYCAQISNLKSKYGNDIKTHRLHLIQEENIQEKLSSRGQTLN